MRASASRASSRQMIGRGASKPNLTGPQVTLRPFIEADLPALRAMVNEAEGNRLTGTHVSFTQAQVDSWYRTRRLDPDRLDLAVVVYGTCVGEVVLNDLDGHNASCAFRISLAGPHVYGRGYGTEATRLVLDHAFTTVGLHRVELEVHAFNRRAQHVYQRLGFVVEGVRRQALRWDERWHDTIVMGLLAPDWHAAKRPADDVGATRPTTP
jgi:RimJ/RimL family protein N-acetyltransferase